MDWNKTYYIEKDTHANLGESENYLFDTIIFWLLRRVIIVCIEKYNNVSLDKMI